jgi:hypothetical protein
MSSGRLAALGTGVMVLVCAAVLLVALLAFTWLIDRASEAFEHEAENPTSSPGSWPGGRRPGGFVTDVGEYSELPGAPWRLDHY